LMRAGGPTADELDRMRRVLNGTSPSEQMTPGITVRRQGPMLIVSGARVVDGAPREVELTPGSHRVGAIVLEVEARPDVCRVAPVGVGSAIFPAAVSLTAEVDESGGILVLADGRPAWAVGAKRHPVAFYKAGANGYLSVLATEESDEWT